MSKGNRDKKQNRVNCRSCKARYDTSGMAPGTPFSCRHCGEVLYAPGERGPEHQDKAEIPFGQAAVDLGFITTAQLAVALKEQMHAENQRLRLGDILVDKGFLSNRQVTEVLHAQGSRHAFLIPGYEIVQKLGEGGMGAVYKGVHLASRKTVAIKVLAERLSKRPEFLERFHREARVAIDLDHPGIVKGFDEGRVDKVHYFVMEYVHGKSAGRVLKKRGFFGERRSMDILRQVLAALDYAHARNIVHRDIKPDNLMLTRDGKVKLADYGLVKFTDNLGVAGLTTEGQIMGTPNYISPEQAGGKGAVDIRSDIYSLGATAYHLLTGRPPYQGGSVAAVMAMHVGAPVPDPREAKADLADEVRAAIMHMMEKDISRRYQSPAEALRDVEAYFSGRPSEDRTLRAGMFTPTPDPGDTESLEEQLGDSELMETVGEDDRELRKTAPLLLVAGLAILFAGLVAALVFIFRLRDGNDGGTTPDNVTQKSNDADGGGKASPTHAAVDSSPEEAGAAALYRESLALDETRRLEQYRLILRKYPATATAKLVEPDVRKREAERRAERERAEQEKRAAQTEREKESQRAYDNAVIYSGNDYAKLETALRGVAEKYPGLPGGEAAKKKLAGLKAEFAATERRRQEELNRASELQQQTENAKRKAEEDAALVKFKDDWLSVFRKLDLDEAGRLARDLGADKRYPGLKNAAAACARDAESLKLFQPAVEQALSSPESRAGSKIELRSGMKYEGKIAAVKDGAFTMLINSRVPLELQVFKLSDACLVEFFHKGYLGTDPAPEVVIGLFYLARGKDKEAGEAFAAAGQADSLRPHHQELLRWK